jgi:hypothetical protein
MLIHLLVVYLDVKGWGDCCPNKLEVV